MSLKRKTPLSRYSKKKTETKAKSKRKTDYVKKLDKVFSLYIRLRDSIPYGGKYIKCISCGQIKPFDDFDNGHYFSRRHMSTRFSEHNCNAECKYCNRFDAEHLHNYEKNLKKKIGEQNFLLLEWQKNQPKKWSDFELQALIEHYNNEIIKIKSKL